MNRRARRHLESAALHEAAAKRHDEAVEYWLGVGDGARAELERRNAEIERAAAELERDRGKHEQESPLPDAR